MDEENYTSFKLSKKLKENGFEWKTYAFYSDKQLHISNINREWVSILQKSNYASYDILNDICVKYAKKMFLEDNTMDIITREIIRSYRVHIKEIFYLLCEWEKKEAEEYIRDNCVFNPKNK